MTKIVLTGGPCAGKTSALPRIREEFEKAGYTVLTVPETATELIGGGVAPWTCGKRSDFQKCRLKLQIEKEKIYERAAGTMSGEKILIVCDRGALDTKCYSTDEEFDEALKLVGAGEVELRDSYDAVFHLVSAGSGALPDYSTGDGTGRSETPEESAELDNKLISAWCGHPHLRVIGCKESFDDKMSELIKEIKAFLGVPAPYEIERKYLIEYPDTEALSMDPFCKAARIEQIYLKCDVGVERIRRRGANGDYLYYHTVKRRVSDMRRIEIERKITKEEYEELKLRADPSRAPVEKTRYCLVYKNRYFEIDVYPFSKERAIAEIELADERDTFEFPDSIRVIKEVTGDGSYSNSAIAKALKKKKDCGEII